MVNMKRPAPLGLLFLLLSLLFVSTLAIDGIATPAIGAFTLHRDSRREIPISSFGLDQGGFFNISLTSFKIESTEPPAGPIGLFVQKSKTASSAAIEVEDLCSKLLADVQAANVPNVSTFYPFKADFESWEINMTITKEDEGLWAFSLMNCNSDGVSLSTLVNHVFYNKGPQYLSAGEAPLPLVMGTLAIVYFLVSLFWLSRLLCQKERKVLWPHWLMLCLVAVKTITLVLVSLKLYYLKKGYHAEGWAISFYVFAFLRGSLTFIILLLIGTGWIFIKPFLSSRDQKIFMIVIPLQILANIAQVVLSEIERGVGSWNFWSIVFLGLDLLCCVLILSPILNTRRHLEQAQPDGKLENLKQKYKLWGEFYILTITYLYFTRIVVQLLMATLNYKVIWLTDLFYELSTLLFYIVVGYKFRPVASNPYLQVETEDEAEVVEEIQMENFSGGAALSHKKRSPATADP